MEGPTPSAALSDSLLAEKILLNLKRGNLNFLSTSQFRLNPDVVVEVLHRLSGNLRLGEFFIDYFVLKITTLKHSSVSLSAMIHVLVRSRRLSDAQALILRMIRRSGVTRVEVIESLVSSACGNPGSNAVTNSSLSRFQGLKFNFSFSRETLFLVCWKMDSNKCNEGYGFVNMTSPVVAWRLYKAFHHQHWEVFNSRKICEVTYARVQGLEALKEHFKNSKFPSEMDHYLLVVFNPPRDGRKNTDPLPLPLVCHVKPVISDQEEQEQDQEDLMIISTVVQDYYSFGNSSVQDYLYFKSS